LALVFEDVTKYYDERIALLDVSFEIREGEIVSLLGPNGSGKTTAMRIAVGLLKPTKGNVYIYGYNVLKEPVKAKRLLGYVSENPPLYDNLTGMEYLELILDLWGMDIKEKIDEIKKLSQILDLEQDLNLLTHAYSAGMKKKIALIGALIHDPKLIIIDEVTANLDPKGIASLKRLLDGLKKLGRAILVSTHVLEIAEELSDRAIILREGRVIWEGETRRFRKEAMQEKRLEDIFFELTGGPEIESIIEYLRKKSS